VDSTVQYISKYHTIADFHLTKREIITQKDYEGKIYVADFSSNVWFYLSKMTTNLSDVQKRLPIIQK
jgi:protein SCO1/2